MIPVRLTLSNFMSYQTQEALDFSPFDLAVIAGANGTGKSTLLVETLYHALMRHFYPFHKEIPGNFKSIEGLEFIDKVI